MEHPMTLKVDFVLMAPGDMGWTKDTGWVRLSKVRRGDHSKESQRHLTQIRKATDASGEDSVLFYQRTF